MLGKNVSKRTIVILEEENIKGNGVSLKHEVIGDKLTHAMAQALVDEGLSAVGMNTFIDLRLRK